MDLLCLAKVCGDAFNCKPIILNKLTECYSYIKNYKENFKLLEENYETLKRERDAIARRVKREEDNLQVLVEGTKEWLEEVKNLIEEVEGLMKKLTDEDERKSRDKSCFRHSRCNLCRRYDMSKEAKSKADKIDAVINNKPNDVTEPASRSDLKYIPNEFLKTLRSRVKLMEEILKRLRDDSVDAVGIFGMGAIGKTTLVKGISNHEDMKVMFKEIVMVEISEAPNLKRIQDRIAEKIDLKLDSFHSVKQRATNLYKCLKRKSKLLIILDNVWSELDLGKVGIPKPNEKTYGFCCKLLVTSREKLVCEAMEVLKDNILEVKPLNDDEEKQLFRARIGAKANEDGWKEQHKDLEERLLKRCGGLPLSIVALADALKNEESLEAWNHFATELEKPMSNRLAKIRGVQHRQAHSILETSYKLMENERKKRFFLLACLFPFGSRIPIEDMMRYGIGLELFENVDNLIEAMEQANRWVEELKSSSLLLQEDVQFYKETHVKIHDVVRASTISLAEQGGDMVMVEGFPRWMSLKSCQKYYAISLRSGSNHSRLGKLNSDNLQILILDGSEPRRNFEDSFFQGMNNLMVLVLRRVSLKPELPNSIRKLKRNLRTLLLEKCKLGDITGIGELTNLVVLSLRESSMVELPEAIGNLCNLRLLDLNECKIKKGGISANVLSKLSLLEGLYGFTQKSWIYDDDNSEEGKYAYYGRIAELNKMSYLKLLHLTILLNDWLFEDDQLQFLKNLDHFRISFGHSYSGLPREYSRALEFSVKDSWSSSIVKDNGVRVLLEKTQFLGLFWMMNIQHINDIKQQEDESKMQLGNTNIHFPNLIELKVYLCTLMKSLSSTPFKAPNLTSLSVGGCYYMKYIFMEYDADHIINTFPALKKMILFYLSELESVTGLIKRSSTTTNDDQQPGHHILFNRKTIFPSLEDLTLERCKRIVQLWEVNCKEKSYYPSFKNLHSLKIDDFRKLETLGSLSIATALEQLKILSISRCPLLREVISSEEIKPPEFGDRIFPSLESVKLKACPELKMFISISEEDQLLKLSSLQHLKINLCSKMRSFSSIGPLLKAPKLKQITLNYRNYPVDETTDINSFLQNSHEHERLNTLNGVALKDIRGKKKKQKCDQFGSNNNHAGF